jgi:polysaccharide pyruvyl transferase WcaK-like protein
VAFVGVGVETITQPEYRTRFRDVIAPYAIHWTVRAANDRDRLLELGVSESRITVAADMAWLLPRANLAYGQNAMGTRTEAGRPLIAVNLNAEAWILARSPGLYATLAAALDRIIDAHNARVVFLFNEIREGPSYDMATAEQVRRLMKRADAAFALPNDSFSPAEMMSIIGACAVAISTRYHFCLFAALQGVPFLALERSDKISDFCADLRWPFRTRIEEASPASLADHANLLLTASGPALRDMEARIAEMRARALVNARGLDALRTAVAETPSGKGVRRAIGRVFDRARDRPA